MSTFMHKQKRCFNMISRNINSSIVLVRDVLMFVVIMSQDLLQFLMSGTYSHLKDKVLKKGIR